MSEEASEAQRKRPVVSVVADGTRFGSKVLIDGVPLKGITSVSLKCDESTHFLWRATITLLPDTVDVSCIDSTEVETAKLSHRHSDWNEITGIPERDPVADLAMMLSK